MSHCWGPCFPPEVHCFTCHGWKYHSQPARIGQTHEFSQLSLMILVILFAHTKPGLSTTVNNVFLAHHATHCPQWSSCCNIKVCMHSQSAWATSEQLCPWFCGISQTLMLWYHRVPIPAYLNPALPQLLRDRTLQVSLDYCTLQEVCSLHQCSASLQ